MRGRAAPAALVIALVMLLLSAPTASAAGAKAIWGPLTVNGSSEFPVYKRLGVGIFEMNLDWAQASPIRPANAANPRDKAYRWPTDVDHAIQQAARYHIRVLLQVSGTPRWANGGRAANYPPTDVRALGRFVAAASRRYPAVHLWMIWGEPSRKPNFASLVPTVHVVYSHNIQHVYIAKRLNRAQLAAPHLYARMLDASYGALKKVSASNLVIGGDTYTTGDITTAQWIANMRLPDGRPPRMDLYGHNPFSWRAPNLLDPPSDPSAGVLPWEVDFSDLGRLEQLVDRNLAAPHRHIKLFLSEWTIPTSPNDAEFGFYVAPPLQAQWITDALRIVRRASFIYALGWIHLFDDPPGHGSSGGLIYSNGQPKPGYYAFMHG